MDPVEVRKAVISKYEEIIGRNIYSKNLRSYCYRPYTNGKYYSDCSSSVSYAYKEAGFGFGILNTVGMYRCKQFTNVPVQIEKGRITDPENLRPGDMLLFAGTDNTRPDCVGHVEMYAGIENGKHILFGHGSGNPKRHEMNAYCDSRFKSKTNTKRGNKGLIVVKRFIQDEVTSDTSDATDGVLRVRPGTWNLRSGPGTDFAVIGSVSRGERLSSIDTAAWRYVRAADNKYSWISTSAIEKEVEP